MTTPKANNVHIEALASAVNHGGAALCDVPWLVKSVIREGAWRCFQPRMGDLAEYTAAQFNDFVTAEVPDGLNATEAMLRLICKEDHEALDLLDQAYQRPTGRPKKSGTLLPVLPNRPEGNTSAKALRRLRKDRPDLHAEVIAERLSPHAAMIEAGFRRPTCTVPKDSVEAAAQALRRHFSPADLADLARRLT